MKQEDFWIEDVEFFSDMMAKITDLSRNLYLLVTDLQKNQTFVPEKTAEFLGMEAGYSLDFYQKLTAHVHPYDIPEYEEAMGKRLKKEALSEPLYIRMGKEKTDYMMGFSVDVLRKENREYLIVVLKNENALQEIDAQTDLYSQVKFEEHIKDYLATRRKVAVLEIEFDHMNDMNILYGTNYSEQMQREIGLRFIYMMDADTAVYRMNSSNFAFILRDADREEAEAYMEKIKDTLKENAYIDGHFFEFKIYASGLILDDYKGDISTVQSKLEYTLEKARERRSTGILFFNDLVLSYGGMDLDLMKIIHQSVLNHCDGFYVEYQPIVTSENGKIMGAEALVRWKKEPYGAIPPGLFIDWLENDPSMYDLGNFVLEQALWDSKLFLQQNPDFFINVNVSAKQLERPDFCRVVLELLDKTEFPVRHLCLEITERCRSLPVSVINERMAVLRGYGIKFAMDDFGTGSSSSAMALEMLIDEIKIDMSFIRKILVNKKNKAIVQSMVDFANAANIKSCLEGVENKALEDYLRTVGATWFQGYYYSKPVGADELEILLSAKK
ncbi:EAL domain-containing protein [Roseburia amylophila]|uniref:Bifunctional diguanylate cyclase/phosphodiesterase n=1 Tax=Roseburia amylophila TaxID=2981794 RepID=A0ABT2S9S5_9FIRM|nr:bifunctional diguanylate cyclase/phosphodiesterase [Roseburia amylophila]MCU6715802.1 bifunctional diguanylate cyclase/phosphodiesterase [Roseburia amylophila]SCG98892.1 Bacteriophytochrome cph2 [uncultured Roseburia sp.]